VELFPNVNQLAFRYNDSGEKCQHILYSPLEPVIQFLDHTTARAYAELRSPDLIPYFDKEW
jgi:hypothetical protein